MFSEKIYSTSLTSGEADAALSHIRIEDSPFREDLSMLSTIRAVIASRMGNDELRIVHRSIANRNGLDGNIENMVGEYTSPGTLLICNVVGNENFEIQNHTLPAWKKVSKITEFFRKSFGVMCYVHEDMKSVLVLVSNMNLSRYHYLQCAILAMFPWYFNPETDKVSELEMNLMQSLRERTPEIYLQCIDSIYKAMDIRAAKIEKLLKGFEARLESQAVSNCKNEVENIMAQIQALNDNISAYLEQKRNLDIRILGLKEKIKQCGEESELMEYFLCNKKISLDTVDTSSITFFVKDYLAYFDEDAAETVINNEDSYMYDPDELGYDDYDDMPLSIERMMKLLNAMFISQKLKVRLSAQFRLEFNPVGLAPLSMGHRRYETSLLEYLPNPHIEHYGCMGSYTETINELRVKNDYIGIIEQCVASCKGLNFHDSTVMAQFVRDLLDHDNGFIELPTGEVVNAYRAIEWLEENEK